MTLPIIRQASVLDRREFLKITGMRVRNLPFFPGATMSGYSGFDIYANS